VQIRNCDLLSTWLTAFAFRNTPIRLIYCYLAALRAFAQRAFCAAAMLARTSGDSWRLVDTNLAAFFPVRPCFALPTSNARACSSFRISASISVRIPFASIQKVYQLDRVLIDVS
jgi:hypothetical protein